MSLSAHEQRRTYWYTISTYIVVSLEDDPNGYCQAQCDDRKYHVPPPWRVHLEGINIHAEQTLSRISIECRTDHSLVEKHVQI
jgi:hypothetical protein